MRRACDEGGAWDMTIGRGCPAVFAGLVGGILCVTSEPAQALSLAAASPDALAEALPPFVAGAAAGAVATGVASVVLRRRGSARATAGEPGASGDAREGADTGERHAAPAGPPRHARPTDWESTGNIRVQQVAAPVPEPAAEEQPACEPDDYADVAESYVRRVTFGERMSTRARGVASVLGDRLGADMMSGLPVIERADGSVGDVGTSWWDDAVGPDSKYGPEAPEAPVVPHPDRAAAIAGRVAEIDGDLFPEVGEPSGSEPGGDAWEAALDALGARAAAARQTAAFEDAIGDADTLDEPDGLEPVTQFIPFRTPAGHPEVVDTDTYVDYLIGQEFSQNPSSAARSSSRAYLHVIDGGGHSSRHLAPAGAPSRGVAYRRPRHLAGSVVQEA